MATTAKDISVDERSLGNCPFDNNLAGCKQTECDNDLKFEEIPLQDIVFNDREKEIPCDLERKEESLKEDEVGNNQSDSNDIHDKQNQSGDTDKGEEQQTVVTFSNLSRNKKYVLVLCTLAIFLARCAFSLIGPFYPLEAERKGMSLTVIGLVFGIFDATMAVATPLIGNHLSTLGPKRVCIVGLLIGGLGNIVFGTLDMVPDGTPFIVACVACRIVESLGLAAFLTANFAIVSNEFSDNVGMVFGILETGAGLGFTIGPSIGGALYELGGFGLPFYTIGVSILLCNILILKALPSPKTIHIQSRRKGSMFYMFRSTMVCIPMFNVLVAMIGVATFNATFARHVEPFGLSVGIVGLIFAAVSLVYSVMSSFWGYLTEKKDIQSPLIVSGQLVYGIGFLLLGPSGIVLPFVPSQLWTICLGLGLIGISFGCCLVPTMKCMVNGALELGFENNIDTYSLVSGLFNGVSFLGGFLGPVAFGALAQAFDASVAYTANGLLCISVMLVSLVFFTARYFKGRDRYSLDEPADNPGFEDEVPAEASLHL